MNVHKAYTGHCSPPIWRQRSAGTPSCWGVGQTTGPWIPLVQWELSDQGGLMLSNSPEIAGPGAIFLYVDDVAGERRRLRGLGLMLGEDIAGDYSTLAQVRDPDGNLLTLATPPSRPFPAT